jgi:cell division protein FtsI (penicillin-binding protein 3)
MEPTMIEAGKMPNLLGMGAKDALYLLERKGIKVELKGLGKVKKQSLNPGAPLRKNQLILLQLG